MVRITSKDIGITQKKLRDLAKVTPAILDGEIASGALHWVERAVKAAPVDLGLLRNGIAAEGSNLRYRVVSNANYSAYLEWGTIEHVSVPPELMYYAELFKGRGIRKSGGIRPRPYFFIHRAEIEMEIKRNIIREIKNSAKSG